MNATDEHIESREAGQMDQPIKEKMDADTIRGIVTWIKDHLWEGEISATVHTRNGWGGSGKVTWVSLSGDTIHLDAEVTIPVVEIDHIKCHNPAAHQPVGAMS